MQPVGRWRVVLAGEERERGRKGNSQIEGKRELLGGSAE